MLPNDVIFKLYKNPEKRLALKDYDSTDRKINLEQLKKAMLPDE